MRVVPEVDLVIDDDPGVIDLGEKTHAGRHLRVIHLLEDGLGKLVRSQFLEWRPCWAWLGGHIRLRCPLVQLTLANGAIWQLLHSHVTADVCF